MANQDNLKTKTLAIFDYGLFLEFAVSLGPYFKKVYYHSPWRSAYPEINPTLIGIGLEEYNVYRCNDFWKYVDEYDVVAFPDVLDADVQLELERMGIPVWGSRDGEEMELKRVLMKEHMEELGLPVSPYKIIKGIEPLREYLKKHPNQWIKLDTFRGTFETFHAKKYISVSNELDALQRKLGPYSAHVDFIVEEAIDDPDTVELAYDGFSIDGQFPDQTLFGIEIKGCGYAGRVKPYDELPDVIKQFNEAIKPDLKAFHYRNFCPPEIRINKKQWCMIDFCARMPSPPSELYHILLENLPEITYFGAMGTLIQPKYNAKYAMEVVIHCPYATESWIELEFPEEMRENIKLRNFCKIDGHYWIVPYGLGSVNIGAIVAKGDSLEECEKKIRDVSEQLSGFKLEIEIGSIDEVNKEIAKAAKLGIQF